MIGIIGYGMVGQAVEFGFPKTTKFIVDPKYNDNTIDDLIASSPEAIFVCVPTPDGDEFQILQKVLDELQTKFNGLIIVKSTVPSKFLSGYNVVFNPEFLSRNTSFTDFVSPSYVIFGGEPELCNAAVDIYNKYSVVNMANTYIVDIPTATLIKYTMNSFFALKVTFMNEVYEAANKSGADYDVLAGILIQHPWLGAYHFQVPGHDGSRGFGGPCLPKDTRAFIQTYGSELLQTAIKVNKQFRGNDGY